MKNDSLECIDRPYFEVLVKFVFQGVAKAISLWHDRAYAATQTKSHHEARAQEKEEATPEESIRPDETSSLRCRTCHRGTSYT
jgi:hypothetical protein